jgi:hypothetical protein
VAEGADTAALAEVVLGHHGAELVEAEFVLPRQDTEMRIVGTVPDGAFHAAYRTIAFNDSANVAIKLEGNAPTVTRAFVFLHTPKSSRAV